MRRNLIMDYEPKDFEDVIYKAQNDLVEALEAYSKAFKEASSANEGIPTITEIENIWSKLNVETREIFLNMISGCITQSDQSKLISSKKANT